MENENSLNQEQQQKINQIKALADVMKEYQLSEIEFSDETAHIRLATSSGLVAPVVQSVAPQAPVSVVAPVAQETAPVVNHQNDILSPMVGVVYLSKDPQSPTFVKVGDTITVGQTICLIEAMKTFNPIKATKAGKITAVLVENGSPVEYDQPLFSVE